MVVKRGLGTTGFDTGLFESAMFLSDGQDGVLTRRPRGTGGGGAHPLMKGAIEWFVRNPVAANLLMLVMVVGGLLFWMRRAQTRPLVALDSGLHEVMGGNQDYEFDSGSSDPLWKSFAGSLNRMVGLLRGGSIEEDELDAYLGVHHAGDPVEPGTDKGEG